MIKMAAVLSRNGAFVLMGLVLIMAFVAPLSASKEVCDCKAPATDDCSWDCYVDGEVGRQSDVQAMSIEGTDGTMDTTAFPPKGWTITVDSKGKGNFRTIQAAINSVPDGNKRRVTIRILDGVYRQKLWISSKKPYIYFKCQSRKTIITWGDTAEKAGGTGLSASTAVESIGFIASDCTFANSAPAPAGGQVGKQAVALRIQGDQGAFYRCGFLGAQDTLYDKAGRHYFRSCDIVGSIDWIFGDGQSFYQYCALTSIAKAGSGSVTAQKRESNSRTGFVFFQCNIGGSGSIYLGRAWGAYSRVIFYQCKIANMIRPEGWMDWADPKRQKTVFYAEFQCWGPGANRNGRAWWSKVLTARQAAPFSSIAFIDGKSWLEGAL